MLNKVCIMGRLCHTPEVSDRNGIKVGRLRLATDRDLVSKDGVKTDFFNVTVFGKTAEFAEKYLAKGRLVCVEGRLQTRDYTDRDQNKRTATEIIADRLHFCDSAPKESAKEEPAEYVPIKPETEAVAQKILHDLTHPPKIEVVEVDDGDFPF